MKFDRFQYLIEINMDELIGLHPIPTIHLSCFPKPEHHAKCNYKIRGILITKKKELVTCEECRRLAK